ncbi:MAG: hypothetical protein HC797_08020 [Anaerolineales bacterium]|nr:hypothetical protein [Anaerolineales bacterium]
MEKGYKIWYPQNDKEAIEKSVIDDVAILPSLPHFENSINSIISEIDVIWFDANKPVNFFEVEHSTPIYSGLLRFNDVLLTIGKVDNFNIVADSERESKFGREVNRPTFRASKLSEKVTFLNYQNIYQWFINISSQEKL